MLLAAKPFASPKCKTREKLALEITHRMDPINFNLCARVILDRDASRLWICVHR